MANPYETDRSLSEYLLFHYGSPEEITGDLLAIDPLNFPARCVSECVDASQLREDSRGLDLGCAVGRGTFELARLCRSVVGIDASEKFVRAANQLRDEGVLGYGCIEEGMLTRPCIARVPEEIDRTRVTFEKGDATDLRDHLGQHDVVLMANLIDRLPDPARCLERIPGLLNPGGQLVITSPYTWMEEFTPRPKWLGGYEREGRAVRTLDGLRDILGKDFELVRTADIPFLLREHARKFQLSVAQASVWRRR